MPEIMNIAFGPQSDKPVYNQEIANVIDFIDDMLRQLTACPSASERNWQEPDLLITRHNHGRLSSMVEGFAADPQLYMPNADKTEVNLSQPPEIKQPENQGALIAARHLARLRTQLRNGSSSAQVSGFHPRELDWVIRPALAKLDAYIKAEEDRFQAGQADYNPDVNDQQPSETTPGVPG